MSVFHVFKDEINLGNSFKGGNGMLRVYHESVCTNYETQYIMYTIKLIYFIIIIINNYILIYIFAALCKFKQYEMFGDQIFPRRSVENAHFLAVY